MKSTSASITAWGYDGVRESFNIHHFNSYFLFTSPETLQALQSCSNWTVQCIWSSKWSKFEILDNFLILFDYFPPCTKYIVLIYPCNLNATKMTMLYCEACQWVSSLQLYSCHPLCVAIRYLIEFWNAIVNNWMKFKKCISLLSEKFLLMWSCEAVEDLSGRTL